LDLQISKVTGLRTESSRNCEKNTQKALFKFLTENKIKYPSILFR